MRRFRRGCRISIFLMIVCLGGSFEADFATRGRISLLPRHFRSEPRRLETGLGDCTVVEKCEICAFRDQQDMEACKETGRKEKRTCTTQGGDAETITGFYSCKYTEADELFAMIRMQMVCTLLGILAFSSVRRQKRSSASLFEQRKAAAEEARNLRETRSSSNHEDDQHIEFASIQQQEKVSLLDGKSSTLEII